MSLTKEEAERSRYVLEVIRAEYPAGGWEAVQAKVPELTRRQIISRANSAQVHLGRQQKSKIKFANARQAAETKKAARYPAAQHSSYVAPAPRYPSIWHAAQELSV